MLCTSAIMTNCQNCRRFAAHYLLAGISKWRWAVTICVCETSILKGKSTAAQRAVRNRLEDRCFGKKARRPRRRQRAAANRTDGKNHDGIPDRQPVRQPDGGYF